MAYPSNEPSDETVRSIRMYQEKLQEIEEQWKFTRNAARQNLLDAIEREGISVQRAADLSGHHRATITSWLRVRNADAKKSHKSDD